LSVVKVGLLGRLEVVADDGTGLAIAGAKQRALVALLALEVPRPVTADRLRAALWPGDTRKGNRNALQHHVSRLRASLGQASVSSSAAGYRAGHPPDDVDSVRFERLAAEGRARLRLGEFAAAADTLSRAQSLRYGPALGEFAGAWAEGERARLDDLWLDVLDARIESDLRLGRHQDVVGELDALVRDHRFRERFWAQLMSAQYRCGRQADALSTFQRAPGVLDRELGVEPRPELRDLEDAVLVTIPGPPGAGRRGWPSRSPGPCRTTSRTVSGWSSWPR